MSMIWQPDMPPLPIFISHTQCKMRGPERVRGSFTVIIIIIILCPPPSPLMSAARSTPAQTLDLPNILLSFLNCQLQSLVICLSTFRCLSLFPVTSCCPEASEPNFAWQQLQKEKQGCGLSHNAKQQAMSATKLSLRSFLYIIPFSASSVTSPLFIHPCLVCMKALTAILFQPV